MGIIKRFWWKVSYTGINKQIPFGEAKFVVQTNQLAFLACIISLFTLFNYWTLHLDELVWLQAVTTLFFLLPLLLNYYHKLRLAKVCLIFSANVSTFLSSAMLGYESGEQYAYFALMIGTIIIFSQKEIFLMWSFSIFSGICLLVLELTDYSLFSIGLLPDNVINSLYLGNILATVAIILLAVNYFRKISEKHINTIVEKTYDELKAVFNNSHDAIFILELQTQTITECNNRALNIFGFQKREDVIDKLFFLLQKSPPDTSHIRSIEQEIILNKTWTADEIFVKQNGEEFWGSLALTRIELEDKKILVARITDITVNKQFELQLENLTYDLKKAQHIAKLGYWHLHVHNKKITYCSEEVYKQYAIEQSCDETPFHAFARHVYATDLPLLTDAIDKALDNHEPFELELRVGTPDNLRWVLTKSDLFINEQGEVEKILCTSLDITERKKGEEKLKTSELNYRKLASNIPDTDIFLFDKEMNIILAEGTIMPKYGLTSSFFEGKSVDAILAPTYRGLVRPLYEAVLKGESISMDIAMEDEFVNMSGVPLRDIYNEVNGGLMVSQNITSRKKNEQELIKAKDIAEKASLAKAQFLSTMSHELRTPLNAVIGITHLLLEDNPKSEQTENLHVLRFSAENLLALINDILDFSKIEAGKIEFEEIEFSLVELMQRLTKSMKLRAKEKHLQLDLKLDTDIPDFIMGDPTKLSQILNNLLSNAIKFTEQGKVSVKVEVHDRDNDWINLLFSVKDTGVGIPEDKLETIFEQFSQADSNTTRRFGGTGLGLTITKKLLQLQDSDIHVNSKPGQGSTFDFILKFKLSEKEVVSLLHTAERNRDKSFEGVKVLLVEDNWANVIIASKFMKKWEVDFEHAENGQTAVEKVGAQHFDLVLMDLQMPVMDGFQAALKIRSFNQTIPIIALTASAMLETKVRIKDAGMNEIITKPFNPDELYHKILEWTNLNLETKPS